MLQRCLFVFTASVWSTICPEMENMLEESSRLIPVGNPKVLGRDHKGPCKTSWLLPL